MNRIAVQDIEIVALTIPETPEASDAGDFRAMVELGNAFCRHDTGHSYFDETPAESLPAWLDQTDTTRVGFVARRDGAVVGAGILAMENEPGARTAEIDVFGDPELWGTGIEDALLHAIESEAAARGRSILQTWTLHRGDLTGELLASPTGFGGIPARDRQTQFQLDHGYTFEQAERNSVFDLQGSFDVVDRLLEEGLAKAGPDYRVATWTAPTPPEYREGFAYVLSRMATDAPSAGMVYEEETWDAARVERRDARLVGGGHLVSVAAVVHVPTGRIVAYNELMIGEDRAGSTHQWGTLVVKEHRGKRLGAIVKGANLRRWHELVPTSPRVSTFNAEENRAMLDINEELGFVPASYAGAWKKVLDA